MKVKFSLTVIMAFLLPVTLFGQVNISEFIQYSKTVKQSDNALYFIDFWATWCAPCIHVKKYLGSLQQQHPENFYIISLSQENPDKVKRFLEKKPTNLAVAIDYNGETFKKYNVMSLPQAVLLNAKGDKIWEGHPANFKSSHVYKFLSQNRKQVAFNKLFKTKDNKRPVLKTNKVYKPKSDFELIKIKDNKVTEFQIIDNFNYLELKGSLKDILAYTLKVYKDQIKLNDNVNYHMYFKKNTSAINNPTETILKALNFDYKESYTSEDVLVLDIRKSKFWDTNQINWGMDNRHYLIGDSDIQADNVSFVDMKFKLSSLLQTPVVIKGNFDETKKHDWKIHYKYYDLMKNDLYDNYGIVAKKEESKLPIYSITKKAP